MTSHFPCKHITIIGLGLLGSSLARIIKNKVPSCHITGCNHSQTTLDKALQLGIIDSATTSIPAAVHNAELVIICTPMGTYEDTAKELRTSLKAGAIVTDIGSVKQYAVDTIIPHLSKAHKDLCVPAHPIAGSEKSGIDAGNETIFIGKKVILTPLSSTKPEAISVVSHLWELAGAVIKTLDAKEHDTIYAHVSHLVQLVISCYMLSATGHGNTDGYQRFIRLAGSNPSMWRDIAITNHKAISRALETFLHAIASNSSSTNKLQTARLALEDTITSPLPFEKDLELPQAIATALMQTASTYASKEWIGTGFRDATSPLLYHLADTLPALNATHPFIKTIQQLQHALEAQDGKAIESMLEDAKERYNSFI